MARDAAAWATGPSPPPSQSGGRDWPRRCGVLADSRQSRIVRDVVEPNTTSGAEHSDRRDAWTLSLG